MENDNAIHVCYDNLKSFVDVYPKEKSPDGTLWENKMPEGVKLTVFCKSRSEEGFLINLYSNQLGLEALIVQKWIIHADLEKLAGRPIL